MIKEFVKLAYKLLHSSDHYNYFVNDAGQIDSSFYTKRITKIISSGFTTSVKEEIKQNKPTKNPHYNYYYTETGYNYRCFGYTVGMNLILTYKGIAQLVKVDNYICAYNLLRMLIYSCVSMYRLYKIEDKARFFITFNSGGDVSQLKVDGKLFSGRNVIKALEEEYTGISRIYEAGCDFVHLSKEQDKYANRNWKDEVVFHNLNKMWISWKEEASFKEDLDYVSKVVLDILVKLCEQMPQVTDTSLPVIKKIGCRKGYEIII